MRVGPFVLGDLLNADTALRDRARFLKAGTVGWAAPGTTTPGSPGLLLGYAPGGPVGYNNPDDPNSTSGTWAVDGGAAHAVRGAGAAAVGRYFATGFTISTGTAWYLTFPAAKKLLGYGAILDALDRYHKDGTPATATYANGSQGGTSNALTVAATMVNVSGSGVLLNVSATGWWNSDGYSLVGFDVYTEGTLRIRVSSPRAHSISATCGACCYADFAYLRYSSSLRVDALWAGAGNGSGNVQYAAQYVHGV